MPDLVTYTVYNPQNDVKLRANFTYWLTVSYDCIKTVLKGDNQKLCEHKYLKKSMLPFFYLYTDKITAY